MSLRQDAPNDFELEVRDDGIGIPDVASGRYSGGFGFLLVETLTRQIGARLERRSSPDTGTGFSLRFSA